MLIHNTLKSNSSFDNFWWSLLLSCPGHERRRLRVHHPWTESYVWPGSCTVESLLISSCQIFQAAFIFKKWASQQVLHGLLWGPAFTGCMCCISIAPFTQVGFAAAHTRAESVLWPGASCSSVGIGSFALQFVVPPTMLALLLEEAGTVAGLYEGSSSSISGSSGLVGGYDRDGECHQLASCIRSCWLLICVNARWGDSSQDM